LKEKKKKVGRGVGKNDGFIVDTVGVLTEDPDRMPIGVS
jgi:hypothetical protein